MTLHRVRKYWFYASLPAGLGAYCWKPVALEDRITGKVYSLVPYLTNEQATKLAEAA